MYLCNSNTVRLVQLVEHQIVVLGVVGSSPTSHPNCKSLREIAGFFHIGCAAAYGFLNSQGIADNDKSVYFAPLLRGQVTVHVGGRTAIVVDSGIYDS